MEAILETEDFSHLSLINIKKATMKKIDWQDEASFLLVIIPLFVA
jgi:hypothetical protein